MNPFEGLFERTWMVTVDDGGVRAIVLGERRARYVPFTDVTDVRVDFKLFGVALLRLVTRGATTTLRVAHDEALFVQAAVVAHLGARATVPANAAALARSGRTLETWLADVRSGSSDDYRAAAMGSAALVAILDDPNVAADVRAAAVHALLHGGREEDLVAVVRAFVRRALPPIVVVAAALAPGGAALVPQGMWSDALAFLSPDDAAQARALGETVIHMDENHVYDLLRRATAEQIAAASARLAAEPRHATSWRKHHASPLGGYANSQGVTRFK